jgi:predicted HD superfamily hydrolase involved in NAD metabolism
MKNRNDMMEQVKSQMPAKRWAHTVGVMESSVILAERFGGDREKAELAALLHDYCKYWPVDKQREALVANGAEEDLLDYDKSLWHGPAAAAILPEIIGVTDLEVLDAVRWHTSGRAGMTILDKIVCLADYIEPGRDFPGVNKIRELAEHSLEQALLAGFDSTISFLLQQGQRIYPLTIVSRNALIAELKPTDV